MIEVKLKLNNFIFGLLISSTEEISFCNIPHFVHDDKSNACVIGYIDFGIGEAGVCKPVTDNLHGVLRTSVRECTVNLTCLYQILVGAVHSSPLVSRPPAVIVQAPLAHVPCCIHAVSLVNRLSLHTFTSCKSNPDDPHPLRGASSPRV